MIIANQQQLYDLYGCKDEAQWKKALFKYGTRCGITADSFPPHVTWDDRLESGGATFSSIVEGVEETTQSYTVKFPCTPDQLEAAIRQVEDEAHEIWMNTHGCEHCWNGEVYVTEYGDEIQPDDAGMRPVDPNCTACGGTGITI